MLTTVIHKSPKSVVDYHTNALVRDDYFFTGKAIAGRFYGELAKELGCPDVVTKKAFSRLVHNKHPLTGRQLTPRNAVNRRAAYEMVFSPSKSISMAMGILGDKDILRVHRNAVRSAMREVEKMAMVHTRIGGRKVLLKTQGIVYSKFDHFTSRPVKAEDGKSDQKYLCDPQLHSHVIIKNCTLYKGKYLALELSQAMKVLPFIEAVYHSKMALGLHKIGYEVERVNNRFEIKGISRELIEKFSLRTKQIETLSKKLGITNAKTKAKLGGTSRAHKSKIKEDHDLIKSWKKRLSAAELMKLQNLKQDAAISKQDITPEMAVQKSLDHFLEKSSTTPVLRVLGKALEYGYGSLGLDDVKAALQTNKDVFKAKLGYLEYCSSRALVRLEDKIISYAAQERGTKQPINPHYKIKRDFLNEDQRRAIREIVKTNTDRIGILSGGAGTGKSTILDEIRMAAQEGGKRIYGFAPTSIASREVLRQKGFERAETVAMLLQNKEMQNSLKNQIILIDEAGLLNTRTMAQVMDIVKAQNARLILSGDIRQHKNPGAGLPLVLLQNKAGLPVARIEKILRQRNNPAYKTAISHLSKGKIRKGFAKLDKIGAIKEIPDDDKRNQTLAHHYVGSHLSGRSGLVVTPTNAENVKVTAHIRTEMKARGRIGKRDKSFKILKSLNLSTADKQDRAKYEKGMIVQAHQNIKGGIKAGEQFEVIKHLENGIQVKNKQTSRKVALNLDQAERFDVFREVPIALAKGEHIRISRNSKDNRGKRLYNGQHYKIKAFKRGGEIELDNGRILPQGFSHFDHAYCTTSHKSQGKDVQDIYISQSSMSFAATNQKTAYVSYSRGSERIMIFTDDKEALKEVIMKSGDEISASALRNKKRQQTLQRNRRRDYQKRIKLVDHGIERSRHKKHIQPDRWRPPAH